MYGGRLRVRPMNEFDQEAVEEMAAVIEEYSNDNSGGELQPRDSSTLFSEIARVSAKYNIPSEDRVDFAVAGLEHHFDTVRMQVISDFRETLESLEALFT